MIKLTRLNGSELIINGDLIETVEATPDTVIRLTTDHTWVVRESPDEVVERVKDYKRSWFKERPYRTGDEPSL